MDTVIATLCLLITTHGDSLKPTVQQLGSEEFRQREKAHKILAKQLLVPWGEMLAEELKRARGDPEIEARVRHLTRGYDDFLTDYGKYPWLCALPKDYPDRESILAIYPTPYSWGPEWPGHRLATFNYLTSLKEKGYSVHDLRRIQRMMIENEVHWYKHGRYP